jgi:hypothetical protein
VFGVACELPTSSTSGASDRVLSFFTAVISSPEEPFGLASTILMPYFLVKASMIVP